MIPCDCTYCADAAKSNPKYFELSVLERAREKGKTKVECDKDFLDVSVMGLLEGVFERDELQRSDRIGFGEKEMGIAKKQEENVTKVTYKIKNLGALGGVGDNHKVKGKIILKESEQKAVKELQKSVTALMQHIGNHQADFEIKAEAYNELKEINKHLDNLENATPETKSKLQELLGNVKDGTLGAIKLAEDIKDGTEAATWVVEKAALVAPIVAALSGGG